MNTNNSLATLLPRLSVILNNSVSGYNKLTESIVSKSKDVYVDIVDDNGNVTKLSLPSFKWMSSEIDRLDNSIKQLSGVSNDKQTSVKIEDSFRRILMSTYSKEGKNIKELNTVNTFSSKINYFFENLLNPALYITLDLTGQVEKNTESVLLDRYILKNVTDSVRLWFNTKYNNKNNIDRNLFLNDIKINGIEYIVDNQEVLLPPRNSNFTGLFSILTIDNTVISETINSTVYSRNVKRYRLNKLTYTDNRYNFIDNTSLKEGDVLILTTDDSTAFKVIAIEKDTNSIILELRDGFGNISIGDNILKIYRTDDIDVKPNINIGFDEYTIIFLKSVSSEFKIASNVWSPGVAFYTNDLSIDDNGILDTLGSYYKKNVLDFGVYLKSMIKDNITPAFLGIIPNTPILTETDFQVVQINKQLTQTQSIANIKELDNQKSIIQVDINEITKSLQLDPTNQNLINSKNTKTETYNSIVAQISSIINGSNLSNYTPKYRLRGFFPIPEPKNSDLTGKQNIIQFLVSYRYLSPDNSTNTLDQFQFNDNGNIKNGVVPDWIDVLSPVRKRKFDSVTQTSSWVEESVDNVSVFNINTIDLPISKGETLEFKVKSVSEAGYPTNPSMSDYSNSIRISFPTTLSQDTIITDLINQNIQDTTRISLQNSLNTIGVTQHLVNSFTKNQKYYSHKLSDIDSGFLTPEQNIITAFDKLLEHEKTITTINNYINKTKPLLNVRIVDSDGNNIQIKQDQRNSFFAGYYTDFVSGLKVQKGAIITKTYFLVVENLSSADLKLTSRIPGSITKRVKVSEDSSYIKNIAPAVNQNYENFGTYEFGDSDYNTMRKYDLVPINLTNSTKLNSKNEISNAYPYQSAQVKSQFIYSRFKDIAKENSFYGYNKFNDSGDIIPDEIVSSISDIEYGYSRPIPAANLTGFIWNGNFDSNTTTVTTDYHSNNDFCLEVHSSHPALKDKPTFINYYRDYCIKTYGREPSTIDVIEMAKDLFKHSKYMSVSSLEQYGKLQAIYMYDDIIKRTVKFGFEQDDQYLLGKQSCGSYLFMSPDVTDSISVDGKSILSKKTISYGIENSVKIPINFQFRMSDYYGTGSEGIGNIDGSKTQGTNLTYIKEIGFDLYDSEGNTFSFDFEVSAKYTNENLSLSKVPITKIETTIETISKNLQNMALKNI